MRKLFVFVIGMASVSFIPVKKGTKTCYYFCVSRSGDITTDGASTKQVILYNKISTLDDGESGLKQKARQWDEWAGNHCASKKPCTSDTNSFPTEEEAEKAYDGLLRRYADTTRFSLQLVDFR